MHARNPNMKNYRDMTLAGIALLVLSAPSAAQTPSFETLGVLPGTTTPYSEAHGVSADGRTVTGLAMQPNHDWGYQAFKWTPERGMVAVELLPTKDGTPTARGFGISADGRIVVGVADSDTNSDQPIAFSWTRKGGSVAHGKLDKSHRSEALAVSDDGAILAGHSRFSANEVGDYSWREATRWTAAGAEGLGFLPGSFGTTVRGMSPDGGAIVGVAQMTDLEGQTAWRWTADEGMVRLGDLPGGYEYSAANDASADGRVVVGFGTVSYQLFNVTDQRAFRWTAEQGMVELPSLPGAYFSEATAVTPDGRVVAGWSRVKAQTHATVWYPDGPVDVHDVMTAHGIDMSAWVLTQATDISADGKTIVGWGIVLGDEYEQTAFRAVLP